MAAVLKDNRSITSLNAGAAGIGSEGAVYLGYLLMENTPLRVLELAWNEIGDAGLKAIATALQANSTLEELDINCCGITCAPPPPPPPDATDGDPRKANAGSTA